MNSLGLTDGYKLTHHFQYPKGTTKVVSNFTPRSDRYAFEQAKGGVVVFGVQYMLKTIKEHFDKNFFMTELRNSPYGDSKRIMKELKDEKLNELKREFSLYTGMDYDVSHFEALWDLGYLPIEVRALEEGTIVPIRVPMLSVQNTIDEFYWITNYLETLISNLLWKPMTSATIARAYKKVIVDWANFTDPTNLAGVDFQGHDFSMRGMDSIEASIASGLGHLTSFSGGDTLPAIWGARKFYNEPDDSFVMGGVPATEHSVMCAGTKDDEIQTFINLMNTFPKGFLSVVSDTWNLWTVLTDYLPRLKEQILGRDGKLVIRPDSGDPVDIICGTRLVVSDGNGNLKYGNDTPEQKGVIELLWDVFGGHVNNEGFKVLDPHIGAIYGDSITLERAEQIFKRLADKGFASTNIVLGIGSFTYQYNTRDTYGFAMKATYVELKTGNVSADGKNGVVEEVEGRPIFKDPITDDGMKKSAKGLLKVVEQDGELTLIDEVSWEDVQAEDNKLEVVFANGEFVKETTLTEIRERLKQ